MGKRDEKPKSGSGKLIGNIIFFAVAVAVAVFVIYGMTDDSKDPIYQRQGDPEGAMRAYLDMTGDFVTAQNNAGSVQKCVLDSDWEWLQDNHETIFQSGDFANLAGAADPSTMMHVSRLEVLKGLILAGPSRKDCEVVRTTVTGDASAEVVVREKEFYTDGTFDLYDYRVYLVKQGKYWKVKDFGGGRAAYENRRQPDDVVKAEDAPAAGGDAAAAAVGGNEAAGGLGDGGAPGGIVTEQQADECVILARARWEAGDAKGAYDNALAAYGFYSKQLGPSHPKTQQTMSMGQRARQALAQSGQLPAAQ